MSTHSAAAPPAQHGANKAPQPARVRKALNRVLTVTTTLLLVLAAAVFLLLAVGPRVLGYQTATMLTGSMSPLINPGDVVVTAPVDVADLAVGDIITYHIPIEDHRVETHRIVEITTDGGSTAVRTKGDANNGVDPWTATLQGEQVYRHAFTVPYLGSAIRTLREPVVLNTLMYGAPVVLVIGALAAIWRKDPEAETKTNNDAGAHQGATPA
ncbi:signal peptidase I [Crystallibacter degradans]|uniref:signal peptidase I n=1 Tax=Crystallibacter degradans TaxID=2726743 RepID=UPI001474EEB9|nr:signal peptidase I [Arthrobacter sp. SF27]NMR28154.1 signal peptidase I [Arthrobacter sp. SF27]